MKGTDKYIFNAIIIISLIISVFVFNESFNSYSDIITFLSIMIGFEITSLSILYNSPLRNTLYYRKISYYKTELHRLKDFYKHALFFEVLSILFLFIVPEKIFYVQIMGNNICIGRYILVLPILLGTIYCFYKIVNDLLKIFVHPTNN